MKTVRNLVLKNYVYSITTRTNVGHPANYHICLAFKHNSDNYSTNYWQYKFNILIVRITMFVTILLRSLRIGRNLFFMP